MVVLSEIALYVGGSLSTKLLADKIRDLAAETFYARAYGQKVSPLTWLSFHVGAFRS